MDDDLPDKPEPRLRLPRFQFSLRTLFIVTTALAVLCSLMAWWGPVLLLLMLAGSVGTFLGLLVCAYSGLENPFDDVRWDVAKCFILGCAVPLAGYGAFRIWDLRAMVIVALSGVILIKALWLDLEGTEIVVVALTALATTAVAALLLGSLFGL